MISTLLDITEILPDSSRYAKKTLCGWYMRQAPGSGMNGFWVPEVRYFYSGSEEKSLRR